MKILISECDEQNNKNSEKLDEITLSNNSKNIKNNIRILNGNLIGNIKYIYIFIEYYFLILMKKLN